MKDYNSKSVVLASYGELKPETIPAIVADQVKSIESIAVKIDEARERGEEAKSLADEASQNDINFLGWGTTKAVEALQKAAVAQADALGDITEAQTVMFQGLQEMSKATSALFFLAVSNRAMTATVIEALKAKLKNLPNLNKTAQEEIYKIIHQLQNQEEIYQLIDKVERNLVKHEENTLTIAKDLMALKDDTDLSIQEILRVLEALETNIDKEEESIQSIIQSLIDLKDETELTNKKLIQGLESLETKLNTQIQNLVDSQSKFEKQQAKAKKERMVLWIISSIAVILGVLGIVI